MTPEINMNFISMMGRAGGLQAKNLTDIPAR